MDEPEAQLAAVAALEEPTRRRLYELVAGSAEPLSRDEAASALDLPRTTAVFHLDRLVEEGLLEVLRVRRSGRTGPGAGRPAKLYRRSTHQVSVSIPPRHYELAGRLLAASIHESSRTGQDPERLLQRHAHQVGVELGSAARPGTAEDVLRRYGFEPRRDESDIVLANCPFQTLAADYPTTVCGMNQHLIAGLLEGLDEPGWSARLDPRPATCCVRLQPEERSGRRG